MRLQSDLARGLAWGLTASSIGASWLVLTRLGLQQTLNAYDLVAFRFGIPAVILLPLIFRGALTGVPPLTVLLMVVGAGVPYGLVLSVGLEFAPAAHGGAFNAGMVPLFTAILSVLVLKMTLSRVQALGMALIPVGGGLIAGVGLTGEASDVWVGQLLFVFAAFLWGVYTVAMRKQGVRALDAVAIVAGVSALFYLPIYPFVLGSAIPNAPAGEIAFQAVMQGLIAGIGLYYAFNRAVVLLGGASSSLFIAAIPVLTALFAIPVLGEIPSVYDIAGIALITAGIYWGSGARLPGRGG